MICLAAFFGSRYWFSVLKRTLFGFVVLSLISFVLWWHKRFQNSSTVRPESATVLILGVLAPSIASKPIEKSINVVVSVEEKRFPQTTPAPVEHDDEILEVEPYGSWDSINVVRRGNKFGYIKKGSLVTGPEFEEAYEFEDGRAMIKSNGKYGFIDESGRFVIPPQFDQTWMFSEGIAVYRIGEKYGHVDRWGRVISPPSFDYAEWFREGLSAVQLNGKFGYIAPTGQFVISPRFDYAWSFENGLAQVEIEGKRWYINHVGEIVRPAGA